MKAWRPAAGCYWPGSGSDEIDNDLAVGRYHPVHRGVYAIGPLSPRGQLQAAVMAGEPHGSLCFASGLAPYDLMAVKATIDIAVPTNRRDSDRLRFHRLTCRMLRCRR